MSTINALQLAKELIRFPSVTKTNAGVIKFLEKNLKKIGFKTKILEFKDKNSYPVENLYARLGTASPNFCYAGHLDVVPPGNLNDWTVNPFKPAVKKGYLIGRGANDMKSSIAAFVTAVSNFSKDNKKFDGSISLLITGDEEGIAINGTKKVVATTFFVPLIAIPSSSPVIKRLIDPSNFLLSLEKLLTAVTNAAIELFISFAPLPIRYPFLTAGLNGLTVQSFKLPGGTTSK